MKITTTLDLTNPQTHYIRVHYRIESVNADSLTLCFPVWSPGSYLVREYQNQVEFFMARDHKGGRLDFEKTSKNRWRIACKKASRIDVSYSVYTAELNVRSCYLDHELAFLNPSSVVFFPENNIAHPVTLKVKVAKGWKTAASPVKRALVWKFKNFDELYDMPVLAAPRLELQSFALGKSRFTMAFWGHHNSDTKKIAADVKKVVAEQIKLFGGHPCSDYVFQVIFAKGKYGGLEHANSSTNMFDGMLLNERKSYLKFISLLSHEHFHLWNVKRIRPAELGPFDYEHENYTRMLWLAEGVTSFYDDHFVLRSGVMKKDEYLALLAENLVTCESQKARLVNSLGDSSFDAWIRFYRPHENSLNTVTSYYLKGGLVMMLLHLRILAATRGRKSLDDVMRLLWKIYLKRPERGLTAAEFWQCVEKCGLPGAKQFARDYVDGVRPIQWMREMSQAGLDFTADATTKKNYLGVVLSRRDGRVIIQNIAEDSPAYHSDLRPQDELIAINGERIETDKQLDHHLQKEKVTLLFSRFGSVYNVSISLIARPAVPSKLAQSKRPGKSAEMIRRRFLV